MHRLTRLLAVLLIASPLAALAQDGGGAETGPSPEDAARANAKKPVADEPAETKPPDISGTWAQRLVTTAISDVPILGDVVTRTVSLQKVDIKQDGAGLELTTRVCDIDVHSTVDVIDTHIPDRFVAAMDKVKRPGRLVERDGGFDLLIPRKTEVLGVRLREPSSEYLPTKTGDPRVFDQDEDGHPGMTVRVTGLIDGSLYLVHRGSDRLLGRLDANGGIAGEVKWTLEQVVLDSTSMFLGQPPDSHPHPDASKHFFEMKRVQDGASCKKIEASRTKLFSKP